MLQVFLALPLPLQEGYPRLEKHTNKTLMRSSVYSIIIHLKCLKTFNYRMKHVST